MGDNDRPNIDLSFLQHDPSLDQAIAGIKNMSIMAHAYREALMQAGFTRAEAMQIITAWITQLTANNKTK